MSGPNRGWAQTCLGTNVCGPNHVWEQAWWNANYAPFTQSAASYDADRMDTQPHLLLRSIFRFVQLSSRIRFQRMGIMIVY